MVSPKLKLEDGKPNSGIVMLDVEFEHVNGWATATLIDDRHAMTAAHNVVDMEDGCAKTVTICRDSRVDPDGIDRRSVDIAIVHYGWAHSYLEQNDFAILRLSKPFPMDKITPMMYRPTPIESGPVAMTIYSFANDLPGMANTSPPQLVESHGEAEYNSGSCLVCHNGGSVVGASGSPIVDMSGVVIAVHRGWTQSPNLINEAVTIGYHGNDVEKFVQALDAYQSPVDDSEVVRGPTMMLQASPVIPLTWD
ncbi:trypsin-like cysteine/serine peptidase domain-containing protein [Xylaria curta]|nr:trypsin-like cysteine/serine peptidase domain-containing protein [Xylaria curta]